MSESKRSWFEEMFDLNYYVESSQDGQIVYGQVPDDVALYQSIYEKLSLRRNLSSVTEVYQQKGGTFHEGPLIRERAYITGQMQRDLVVPFMHYLNQTSMIAFVPTHAVDYENTLSGHIPVSYKLTDSHLDSDTPSNEITSTNPLSTYVFAVGNREDCMLVYCLDPIYGRDGQSNDGLFSVVMEALEKTHAFICDRKVVESLS